MTTPVETQLPHLVDCIQQVVDKGVEFYLASNESLRPHLNTTPYGLPLSWIDFTRPDQTTWDIQEFLNLFNVINGIAFGDRGIPMPQWVMVDLILMPSATVVAALPQDAFATLLDAPALRGVRHHLVDVQERIRSSGYEGPVPVGGYCAAPSAAPGTFVGWSLWSMMTGIGLGRAVKALALSVYRTQRLDGVTQYDNSALKVHTNFGRMRIMVATVPFHTSPGSFVYENDLTLPARDRDEAPTFLLDPFDYERQRAMQKTIEAGEADFYVLSPGHLVDKGATVVPILEVPRAGA
jgi:hypothetical protein